MALDSAIWLILFVVAVTAVGAATGDIETTQEGVSTQLEGQAGLAGLALWFGLGIGYHTLLEWASGKTLGKYLVSIRVVNEDGSSLSLWRSVVRNALRLVDWLPVFYFVGILALVFSDRHQRLGDRLGKTVVVRT